MAYHKGSPPWQLIDGLYLVLNGNSAPFTRERLRDWRKRESEGKRGQGKEWWNEGEKDGNELCGGDSDHSSVSEPGRSYCIPQRYISMPYRLLSLCNCICHMLKKLKMTSLFFPPLVTGEMSFFFFFFYESEAIYWFTLHGELPVAL